jgi:hypothetical protein
MRLYINTQQTMGTFAFITLITAATAIGHRLGLGVWDALYVATLGILIAMAGINHFTRHI